MEALAFLLGIIVVGALAILPIATFILVLKVRNAQEQQAKQLEVLLSRGERLMVEKPVVKTPEPQAAPAPASVAAAAPPPTPALQAVAKSPVPVASRTPAPAKLAAPPPPMPPPVPPPVSEPSAFQVKATQMLRRIWNWIIIGEEYRTEGTSWEFAVATNWLLRVGVVVVVIGIGFFLKYSIEHGLLGPMARVALSLVTGLVMLVGGVRLLNRPYHLLGQGLIGGGLATLYFSLYAASQLYHLIAVLSAFGLMALVTLSAGVLAVRFNSLLIAILGILGGYGTPIMLSTGVVNFPGLFGYMLLLGLGILGIARRRQWPLLNYLGMLLTYGLALAAISRSYTAPDFTVVLGFLCAFFALYATVVILHNIAENEKITLLELLGSLANTMAFFGLAYHVITVAYAVKYAALLTLALAAFYLALTYLMLIRRRQDRALLSMFIAFAALFLALTPPLAISRQWVTTSWALQGLIMLWLAGRLDSRFLRLLACAAYVLAMGRLVIYDFNLQFTSALPADTTWQAYLKILGERLLEMGVPIAALGGAWKLLRQPPAQGNLVVGRANDLPSDAWQPSATTIAAVVGVGLLFVYAQFELFCTCRFFYAPLAVPAMTVAWFGLGLFLLFFARQGSAVWAAALLAIAGGGMIFKLLAVDMDGWGLSHATWFYEQTCNSGVGLVRLMDYGLCLGLFALVFAQLRKDAVVRPVGLGAGIVALALLFIYLTLELNTALNHFVPNARAGGVTLLWAAYALTLLLFGLQRTVRGLRYAGLAIFAVVIFKIFFADLAHLDAFYRIIAFIVLGLILLCAALIYLKFRQRFQRPSAPGDKP